ncbi:hypothetical protein T06_10850, partial [Trichinella sp. T6]
LIILELLKTATIAIPRLIATTSLPKETLSSIWKIPCQAIMFGVSEKRPSNV